jgi:hypothetical protein
MEFTVRCLPLPVSRRLRERHAIADTDAHARQCSSGKLERVGTARADGEAPGRQTSAHRHDAAAAQVEEIDRKAHEGGMDGAAARQEQSLVGRRARAEAPAEELGERAVRQHGARQERRLGTFAAPNSDPHEAARCRQPSARSGKGASSWAAGGWARSIGRDDRASPAPTSARPRSSDGSVSGGSASSSRNSGSEGGAPGEE